MNDPSLPLAHRLGASTESGPRESVETEPTVTDIYHILGRRRTVLLFLFFEL